jgi:hypothetical protein
VDLRRPRRSTRKTLLGVLSHERAHLHDHQHDLDTVDYITTTPALVQAVRTGPPHGAAVNGWAAIESLMVGPADEQDVIAARR